MLRLLCKVARRVRRPDTFHRDFMPHKMNPTAPTELLAPAGDWDALRAAAANGADAVYFGLDEFNARHRAENFSRDDLSRVMQFLHERGMRGYATFNTLLFSDELPRAVSYLLDLLAAGVDALIVQDVGLAALVHRMAPLAELHASTQMTLTEGRGIGWAARRLGISRVVVARELSLDDLRAIGQATPVPLEVFVHGALCVAYSGQCLTSEALGARSANRGQCAQACRLPYELVVDGRRHPLDDLSYLLSPRDLAAHDLVGDLVAAGARSLKIEGRLKSAEYVAATVQTYRRALDQALAGRPFVATPDEQESLAQSFSRGFSQGFLGGVNHQALVEGRCPKHRGLQVGQVVGRTARGVLMAAGPDGDPHLKPGDGVVFDQGHPEQDEQGGRVFSIRAADSRSAGDVQRGAELPRVSGSVFEVCFGTGQVQLASIEVGSLVWRTDDPAIRRRLARSFVRDRAARRTLLSVRLEGEIGGPLRLIWESAAGELCETVWHGPLARAEKRPLSADSIRPQLERLVDTPFELAEVRIEIPDPVWVPVSVLNELRRQATAQLIAARTQPAPVEVAQPDALAHWRGEIAAARTSGSGAETVLGPRLHVLVRSIEQLQAVLEWSSPAKRISPIGTRSALVYCDFEDVRRYREAVVRAHDAGRTIGLATLRINKPLDEPWLALLAKAEPDVILVRTLAGMVYFQEQLPRTPWVADYSLNITNELSAAVMLAEGARRLTPSYDLNWEQLVQLLERSDPASFEVVVHQHLPMFHMEHCDFAHVLSEGKDYRDCGRPCEHHRVELRDRVGAHLPLVADAGCRNTVFYEVPQSAAEYLPRMLQLGVGDFRVELLRESGPQVGPLLDRYARVLAGVDNGAGLWRELRALGQLGVTRGTLQVIS